jgi:hypothetical protein
VKCRQHQNILQLSEIGLGNRQTDMGGVGKPGKWEAKFTGGVVGALTGGGVGAAGHWATANLSPSMRLKLSRRTMLMSVGVSAVLGTYMGAMHYWENYLSAGK